MKTGRKISALFMALLLFCSTFVSNIEVSASDIIETNSENAEETNQNNNTDVYSNFMENEIDLGSLENEEKNEETPKENSEDETVNGTKEVELATGSINCVAVNQPYLTSPGIQKIVISYGDGTENVTEARIVYQRADGTIYEDMLSERQDDMFLFEHSFTSTDKGVYTLLRFVYMENGVENTIDFPETGIQAMFGVDEEYPGYNTSEDINDEEIEVSVVEVETNNVNTVEGDIEDAIEDTAGLVENKAMISRAAARTVTTGKDDVVVVLDPGHGGADSGAVANGLYEKNLTLKIAQYCKAELEEYSGVTVYMTRETDVRLGANDASDLKNRVDMAASWGADLLVSIHINAGGGTGAEVYYPNSNYNASVGSQGKEVAQQIQNKLVELGLTNRGIKVRTCEEDKYEDGSLQDYYGIIRRSKLAGFPGIIVEHAFIDNANDAAKLRDESFLKKCGIADATGIANYFKLSKSGWVQDDNGWKYEYKKGLYYTNGWYTINGYKYYFDGNGYRQTGWMTYDNEQYYFDAAGRMVVDWYTIDNERYYFGEDGKLYKKGWLDYNGRWYYMEPSTGKKLTGWQEIEGEKYYILSSGGRVTDWQTIDDKRYYFDGDGKLYDKGWLNYNGRWYYMEPGTGDKLTGWLTLDGAKYYILSSGGRVTDWQTIDGKRYYFDEDGKLYDKGWLNYNGRWYYMEPGTGDKLTGLLTLDGAKYYVLNSGGRVTGWQTIDGKRYYFDEDGKLYDKGWLDYNGRWYYMEPGTGDKLTGWLTLDGATYYVLSSGGRVTGWQTIDGKRYYFDEEGKLYDKGWLDYNGRWYYMEPDTGDKLTGWLTLDGAKYYILSSGGRVTGWQTVDGKRYYFDEDGKLYDKGWLDYNGRWYYMEPGTGDKLTGWLTLDGETYYILSSGGRVTGWQIIEGTTYFFDDEGKMISSGLTPIMGKSLLGNDKTTVVNKMVTMYIRSGRTYPSTELGKGGASTITKFCQILYEEAIAEGVVPEVVFGQAMNETGYLQFGGDVLISQYNFAGLGATGGGVHGNSFKDVQTGLRAQVQHLKAYACKESLNKDCVDERFVYVKRGTAPYVEWLGIQENPYGVGWAAAKNYGYSLVQYYIRPMYTL